MTEGVQEHAIRYQTLLPEVIKAYTPFFPGFDLRRVRVVIVDPKIVPGVVWVVGNTVYAIKGCLNRKGYVRGFTWDLTTAAGFAQFGHELYHVYWNLTANPFTRMVWYLEWTWAKLFGNIANTRYERVALDFQARIRVQVHAAILVELSRYRGVNGTLPALPWPGNI